MKRAAIVDGIVEAFLAAKPVFDVVVEAGVAGHAVAKLDQFVEEILDGVAVLETDGHSGRNN